MRKAVTAMQSASQFYAGVEVGLIGGSVRQSPGRLPARQIQRFRSLVCPSVRVFRRSMPPPVGCPLSALRHARCCGGGLPDAIWESIWFGLMVCVTGF